MKHGIKFRFWFQSQDGIPYTWKYRSDLQQWSMFNRTTDRKVCTFKRKETPQDKYMEHLFDLCR